MENLFGTIGTVEPKYLLKSQGGEDAEAKVAISVEPGNGIVPAGAVMYRKSGAFYAPAATANISAANNLVVLAQDVDSDASATVAAAAAAYRKGVFIAGKVLYLDSSEYKAITAAHAVVLRGQNIELAPMDDWSESEVTLTATPASNYALDYWEVVSGDVTVESNKFTIGDSAVTVKAHFKATT